MGEQIPWPLRGWTEGEQVMAPKKGKKNLNRPPEGRIRVSQLVTTFGPGAMVDLLDHAVLVGGLDYWRYDSKLSRPAIEEERLREAVLPRVISLGLNLSQGEAFLSGPKGNEEEAGPWNGIQVAEFPLWFVCQGCSALSHYKSLEQKGGRYRHQCSRTKVSTCVPVRFVATCKHGHLDEFPWNFFVHQEGSRCDGQDLYFEESGTGDFSELVIRCDACQAQRALSEARTPEALPKCKGRRPWLGRQADEACDEEHMQILSRTASNAYFSQTVSVLSIPEKGRDLQKAVSSPRLWKSIKKGTSAETVAQLRLLVDEVNDALRDITGKSADSYSDQEIADAVNSVHGGKDAPREGIRTAEYKEFLTAKDETAGELPPRDEDFFASRWIPTSPLPSELADIALVKKLRRVTAQVGFTRLNAPTPDLQGDYSDGVKLSALTLSQEWLPATETFGEGVLIRFDEARIREWEERPLVVEREKALLEGYTQKFGEGADTSLFPGVRYFMLHSLSHLLMSAMSLECGYAAASLGERIYCAPSSDATPMAAILIMTGSSGAEGTLGGLVEQGRRVTEHLKRARDMGRLCSNDPVCASHTPRQGQKDPTERYLEGVACHGCLYVAEPSCERFNNYLDRALVVPTMGNDPSLAFFGEKG